MTRRAFAVSALSALLAALVTSSANAQSGSFSVDGTLDRATAAWNKVKTVQGTFQQTVSNPITGGKAAANGTYAQARPNKLSIRFDNTDHDAIVSDGTALWLYLPSSTPGQVIKRPANERAGVPIDITGQFLDSPHTRYDISAAGTRTVDGHKAHGLLLVAKKDSDAPVNKATVWIDDDDSLIREFESVEQSGVIRHVYLMSLRVDGPVDPAVFTFVVPKNVKVVDQSK